MSNNAIEYKAKQIPDILNKLGLLILAVGVVLGILAFYTDHTRAIFNYLIAFIFLLSVGVGSIFLISLEYITGAVWSVPFRRIVEFMASVTLLLFILVIPLLFNMHDLFHWTHTEAVAGDEILKGKSPYLNTTFFIIRVFAGLVIWSLFYLVFTRNSKKQELSQDQHLTTKNIRLSAVFIPIFAITITVSAIDWMMSLEPHWFSTIFGVYFFSGTVLAALAAAALIVVLLKDKGFLHPKITDDHLYSFGALMFTFINFWGYIAFSQYMLIWYANLPEENFWFLQRWEGGWIVISILLIIIHFVVPYAALLSQPAKMDPKRLKFASIWIMFAHLFDLYWLIMPNLESEHGYTFSWIDLVFPVSVVGILILVFNYNAKKYNLLPLGDPKLERGLNFRL